MWDNIIRELLYLLCKKGKRVGLCILPYNGVIRPLRRVKLPAYECFFDSYCKIKLRITGHSSGQPQVPGFPSHRTGDTESVSISLLFWRSTSIDLYPEIYDNSICERLPLTLSFHSSRIWNTNMVYSKWRHDMEMLPALLALYDLNPPVTKCFPLQMVSNGELYYLLCC